MFTETQITQQHSKVYDLIDTLANNVGTTNVIQHRQTCYDYLKCRLTSMNSDLWHLAVCQVVTAVALTQLAPLATLHTVITLQVTIYVVPQHAQETVMRNVDNTESGSEYRIQICQ